jgi:hypothetical protein
VLKLVEVLQSLAFVIGLAVAGLMAITLVVVAAIFVIQEVLHRNQQSLCFWVLWHYLLLNDIFKIK